MSWEKEKIMDDLQELISRGAVDKGVIDILILINGNMDLYTTSSCEGRVQLIQMEKIGDKKGSIVLGKWHTGVTREELDSGVSDWDGAGYIYLNTQSPILHVRCRTLDSAVRIRQMGFENGFRYSSILSLSVDGDSVDRITVELLTSLRVDVPIGFDGKLFPDDEYLDFLIERCNTVLGYAKERLLKLKGAFHTWAQNDYLS